MEESGVGCRTMTPSARCSSLAALAERIQTTRSSLIAFVIRELIDLSIISDGKTNVYSG